MLNVSKHSLHREENKRNTFPGLWAGQHRTHETEQVTKKLIFNPFCSSRGENNIWKLLCGNIFCWQFIYFLLIFHYFQAINGRRMVRSGFSLFRLQFTPQFGRNTFPTHLFPFLLLWIKVVDRDKFFFIIFKGLFKNILFYCLFVNVG